MRVEIVPCYSDNYAYLLVDEEAGSVVVVDASEPEPVLEATRRVGLPLVAILSTHHHPDHVGGNEDIVRAYPRAQVFGHRSDLQRIPAITSPLDDGQVFGIGSLRITARHVPGHTLGALTYVVEPKRGGVGGMGHDDHDDGEPAWAFTGDTLFLAGCGRLFEGTAAQMHHSLNGVLGALPPQTRVACGHEYTASNLAFARHVEPDNVAIGGLTRDVEAKRSRGEPTVPGTIRQERATNPFMRVGEARVRAHVGLGPDAEPVEVLARLRREKDGFRAP